jgi:hypothetical protein
VGPMQLSASTVYVNGKAYHLIPGGIIVMWSGLLENIPIADTTRSVESPPLLFRGAFIMKLEK